MSINVRLTRAVPYFFCYCLLRLLLTKEYFSGTVFKTDNKKAIHLNTKKNLTEYI